MLKKEKRKLQNNGDGEKEEDEEFPDLSFTVYQHLADYFRPEIIYMYMYICLKIIL